MWAPFKTAAAIVAIVPCRRSDAGAGVPIRREYAADERLSRCANQNRILGKSSNQLIEVRDQLEVLFLTLTKPDTRIDHDRLARHATPLSHVNTRAQTADNFFHDVRNRRQTVHRRGRAA